MQDSDVNLILQKLVVAKRHASEQRLSNLASALERCLTSIDELMRDINSTSLPNSEFTNDALSAINNLAGRRALEISMLSAHREQVQTLIETERLTLKKALFSEQQLKNIV